ncbi:MAG: hypothetical protein QNK03_28115 [Myxococcota bacterium]|nr:hypothetical protein [Myxococcota bacterium]
MTEEQRLIEKLRRIETLFSRASSVGERTAAQEAARRLQQRLDASRANEILEFRFSLPDAWAKALFIALLRRHGVTPFRYSGQRRNTVMARAPKDLVDQELWPEFQELHKTLHSYLSDVTERVIASAIHGDVSEPEVRAKPRELMPGSSMNFE